jgi:adenylylsulfate kinase-like enzyme
MKRILIMGLPGAGKTYLAQHILDHLQANRKTVMWLNADDVRKKYNDWDFSHKAVFARVCGCVSWLIVMMWIM